LLGQWQRDKKEGVDLEREERGREEVEWWVGPQTKLFKVYCAKYPVMPLVL